VIHRASPLDTEDRGTTNLDAAIPLLIEHGNEVTTRQITEGIVIRAFDDAVESMEAAHAHFKEPASLRTVLGTINPVDPFKRSVHTFNRDHG
jgi:hypothetical protein